MQKKTYAHGRPALAMDALQTVNLGAARHWIRVRGTGTANPPLLLMQLGPELPIINEARRFEQSAHTPHLEEPERFRDVVMMVRTSHTADTS